MAETEHTEGELEGMTTYRLYLYTPNEGDFVVSCSGDDENPLYLASTSEPAWFQHEVATTAFATDVNPAFFASFPEFAFDSWLTIGAEDNTAAADVIRLDSNTGRVSIDAQVESNLRAFASSLSHLKSNASPRFFEQKKESNVVVNLCQIRSGCGWSGSADA